MYTFILYKGITELLQGSTLLKMWNFRASADKNGEPHDSGTNAPI